MKALRGKTAVITGAGSGLGRELADGCARRGMKLVLADVNPDGLKETHALLVDRHGPVEAETICVDVSRIEQVEAMARLAVRRFGAAHLLFNNAGVGVGGAVWENSEADWQWVLQVNLFGVAWGIKTFVPLMLEQNEGHIVNVASAAGWMSAPGSGIYNVSKASVVALSESLAADLEERGANVGVSVVSPAFFRTPMIENASRVRPSGMTDSSALTEAARKYIEQTRRAMEHGKVSATQIAELTLAAVERGSFYVFPHEKVKSLVTARADAVQRESVAFNPYRKDHDSQSR